MALYLVIQVSAFLSRYVPRSLRYLIGTAVGDLVYRVWPAKRRVLRENMATVLGLAPTDPQVRRLSLKSMRNYCKYLIEFLELPALTSSHDKVANMKIQGLHHLQSALGMGRGVILASAHFGTIEIPGLRLRDFTDFHAVYDRFRPGYLDRLIQSKRREKGINLIPASDVRQMIRVLRAGGTLAMLVDRPVDLAKGVPVRLFGRDTALPGGPALLAMKTGAVVIPAYTIRHPDKSFEAILYPPITPPDSGNREEDMRTIMQRFADTMQSMIRSRPDQWYMFRPMWPGGPLLPSHPEASASPGAAG